MSLDLSTFDTKTAAEAGTFVHLESPATGEPLYDDASQPIGITILGGDSEKVRRELRKISDRKIERIRKGQSLPDAEASRKEDIAVMAAATVSWQGLVVDGVALECTESAARKLYGDPRFPWIMEQLEKVLGDRKRFFATSSPA